MLFLPKRQIPSVTTRKPQTVPDGGTSYKTPDSTLALSKSVKVRKDRENVTDRRRLRRNNTEHNEGPRWSQGPSEHTTGKPEGAGAGSAVARVKGKPGEGTAETLDHFCNFSVSLKLAQNKVLGKKHPGLDSKLHSPYLRAIRVTASVPDTRPRPRSTPGPSQPPLPPYHPRPRPSAAPV